MYLPVTGIAVDLLKRLVTACWMLRRWAAMSTMAMNVGILVSPQR
jgi:hypothetical protein